MEWRINGGDKTLNFDSVQNLYVREKNGHIDKVGATNWPTLMKIKHFFVEIFTDFKYFEGNEAFKELKRNSSEVEANTNIDFSHSENNLNPFGKHISLKIHQVSSQPPSHTSAPINEFDEDNLNDSNDTPKPKSTDQETPPEIKLKPRPQVEDLPKDYKLDDAIIMGPPKSQEKPVELPQQGLNKFPSEINPEIKATVQNVPEPIIEREPQIQPAMVNQGPKKADVLIPEDVVTPNVDTELEGQLQDVKLKATPAQLQETPMQETPNRLETLKAFINEFKADPLINRYPITSLINKHELDATDRDDYNLLKEIAIYFDRKAPHEIEKDDLSGISDEIKFNLYGALLADRIERGALDKSLGIPEFRKHLSEEWKDDLDRRGLELALNHPNLRPEDIKFYVEKLGMRKDDPLLKEMMLKHDYVLGVAYRDGRTTVIGNEYLKSGDLDRYSNGSLTFDPSTPSIFA
jgi:hypothetical protein